jgi:hypothetical protein
VVPRNNTGEEEVSQYTNYNLNFYLYSLRYIPQAWTKFYEFSFADLRAASDVIESISQATSKQQVWF